MKITSYIFRSIQLAVMFILIIVMTSCSMYPSIESHHSISASSSILNVLHNDLQQQQSSESDKQQVSTAGTDAVADDERINEDVESGIASSEETTAEASQQPAIDNETTEVESIESAVNDESKNEESSNSAANHETNKEQSSGTITDAEISEMDDEQVHFADLDQIETMNPADVHDEQIENEEGDVENEDEQANVEGVKQKGEPSVKKIAITFDDGPDQKYTPMILDILQKKDVKATFYVVGMQVKKYPEVLKRIEAEGHLIGNHSYFHPNFTKLSKRELKKEIDDTDEEIFAVLGHVPTTVRPPYGALNDEVKKQLEAMGKTTVLWNIDPRDWDGTAVNDMYDNITENARDGGNILLHSFGSKHVANTVKLLPLIIDELRSQGYQFVTVDELIEE